jgi:hypothetical protein
MARDPAEPEGTTFTLPLLGALFSSLVIVALVALLNSHLGRDLDDKIDAPARTLIAGPVIISATVVFVACMIALIQPAYRRRALRVAEIGAWVIPAWLVMCAMVLGAISFALSHAD